MKSYVTITLIGLFVFFSGVNTSQARPHPTTIETQETRKVIKKKKKKRRILPPKTSQIVADSGSPIDKARAYIGMNARQLGLPLRLWCADFMNMLFGGRDRRAISYARRGSPASHGCTNCIAVTKRKGGHHVGIVKGYDAKGNPILISGNHGRRVGIGTYSKKVVIAYRYMR
jgi:hypothetical protein